MKKTPSQGGNHRFLFGDYSLANILSPRGSATNTTHSPWARLRASLTSRRPSDPSSLEMSAQPSSMGEGLTDAPPRRSSLNTAMQQIRAAGQALSPRARLARAQQRADEEEGADPRPAAVRRSSMARAMDQIRALSPSFRLRQSPRSEAGEGSPASGRGGGVAGLRGRPQVQSSLSAEITSSSSPPTSPRRPHRGSIADMVQHMTSSARPARWAKATGKTPAGAGPLGEEPEVEEIVETSRSGRAVAEGKPPGKLGQKVIQIWKQARSSVTGPGSPVAYRDASTGGDGAPKAGTGLYGRLTSPFKGKRPSLDDDQMPFFELMDDGEASPAPPASNRTVISVFRQQRAPMTGPAAPLGGEATEDELEEGLSQGKPSKSGRSSIYDAMASVRIPSPFKGRRPSTGEPEEPTADGVAPAETTKILKVLGAWRGKRPSASAGDDDPTQPPKSPGAGRSKWELNPLAGRKRPSSSAPTEGATKEEEAEGLGVQPASSIRSLRPPPLDTSGADGEGGEGQDEEGEEGEEGEEEDVEDDGMPIKLRTARGFKAQSRSNDLTIPVDDDSSQGRQASKRWVPSKAPPGASSGDTQSKRSLRTSITQAMRQLSSPRSAAKASGPTEEPNELGSGEGHKAARKGIRTSITDAVGRLTSPRSGRALPQEPSVEAAGEGAESVEKPRPAKKGVRTSITEAVGRLTSPRSGRALPQEPSVEAAGEGAEAVEKPRPAKKGVRTSITEAMGKLASPRSFRPVPSELPADPAGDEVEPAEKPRPKQAVGSSISKAIGKLTSPRSTPSVPREPSAEPVGEGEGSVERPKAAKKSLRSSITDAVGKLSPPRSPRSLADERGEQPEAGDGPRAEKKSLRSSITEVMKKLPSPRSARSAAPPAQQDAEPLRPEGVGADMAKPQAGSKGLRSSITQVVSKLASPRSARARPPAPVDEPPADMLSGEDADGGKPKPQKKGIRSSISEAVGKLASPRSARSVPTQSPQEPSWEAGDEEGGVKPRSEKKGIRSSITEVGSSISKAIAKLPSPSSARSVPPPELPGEEEHAADATRAKAEKKSLRSSITAVMKKLPSPRSARSVPPPELLDEEGQAADATRAQAPKKGGIRSSITEVMKKLPSPRSARAVPPPELQDEEAQASDAVRAQASKKGGIRTSISEVMKKLPSPRSQRSASPAPSADPVGGQEESSEKPKASKKGIRTSITETMSKLASPRSARQAPARTPIPAPVDPPIAPDQEGGGEVNAEDEELELSLRSTVNAVARQLPSPPSTPPRVKAEKKGLRSSISEAVGKLASPRSARSVPAKASSEAGGEETQARAEKKSLRSSITEVMKKLPSPRSARSVPPPELPGEEGQAADAARAQAPKKGGIRSSITETLKKLPSPRSQRAAPTTEGDAPGTEPTKRRTSLVDVVKKIASPRSARKAEAEGEDAPARPTGAGGGAESEPKQRNGAKSLRSSITEVMKRLPSPKGTGRAPPPGPPPAEAGLTGSGSPRSPKAMLQKLANSVRRGSTRAQDGAATSEVSQPVASPAPAPWVADPEPEISEEPVPERPPMLSARSSSFLMRVGFSPSQAMLNAEEELEKPEPEP
jgi:hypothetical protein